MRRKTILTVFLILIAIKLVSVLCFSLFLKHKYVVPILMYHSVSLQAVPGDRLIVSVEAFQRQMRYLKERNYNILSLSDLVDLISQKIKIPPRTVAITFDDGYKNNYTYAFPILKKY